jgi:hypothetical protein
MRWFLESNQYAADFGMKFNAQQSGKIVVQTDKVKIYFL